MKFIEDILSKPDEGLQMRLLYTLLVLILIWVIRIIAVKIINKLTEDPMAKYSRRKTVSYFIALAGFFIVGSLWIRGIGTIGKYLRFYQQGLHKRTFANIAG